MDSIDQDEADPDEINVGDIYQDCSYHPVLCEEVDLEDDSVYGVSLCDGTRPRSCSIKHCGVKKLTKEEADASVAVFKESGLRGLMILCGWTPEHADEFIRKWR